MKKWITCIFSFYILLGALVPCSVFDDCGEKDQATHNNERSQNKDCTNCSPFSICSTSQGITTPYNSLTFEMPLFYNLKGNVDQASFTITGHRSTPFQPPRKSC